MQGVATLNASWYRASYNKFSVLNEDDEFEVDKKTTDTINEEEWTLVGCQRCSYLHTKASQSHINLARNPKNLTSMLYQRTCDKSFKSKDYHDYISVMNTCLGHTYRNNLFLNTGMAFTVNTML